MAGLGRPSKYTPEERAVRLAAYHREYSKKYRKEHPEKVREWRENAAIRMAEKILARRGAERKAAEETGAAERDTDK